MLTHKQIDKLKNNWGAMAHSLECKAEVRLYDPNSAWECYLIAMEPDTERLLSIVNGEIDDELTLPILGLLYNLHGEPVQVDKEYRPRKAVNLIRGKEWSHNT